MSGENERGSHCSWCGSPFAREQAWPRTCGRCQRTSYRNPIPVTVVLLPVDAGLLVVRRTIEPGKGKLALPGGFVNQGETWQEAGARELQEETGIRIHADELHVREVLSAPAPDVTLVIFAQAGRRKSKDLPRFEATDEASECRVLEKPEELAFSLHTDVVKRWFAR